MTTAVGTVSPVATATTDPAHENRKVTSKVAREFEEVFLHQILQSSHVLGKGDSSGYAGMALDALASGLSQAGGVGLARTLQSVIDRAQMAQMHKPSGAEAPVESTTNLPKGT